MKHGDRVRLKDKFTYQRKVYDNETKYILAGGNSGTIVSAHSYGRVTVKWDGHRDLSTDVDCVELIPLYQEVSDEEVADLFHLRPTITFEVAPCNGWDQPPTQHEPHLWDWGPDKVTRYCDGEIHD